MRRKQPEVIYHLAAQSNPQGSLTDPRGTWTLNLVGSLNLLEAVKSSGQKPRVILVGSGVSYGNPAPEFIPVREDCPLRPNNPYAASKAAVDLLGIQHHLAYGTDVVMVRPFNHAGPRQSSRYVLAALALQVAEVESGRRDCLEVGNLDVVRDFTDVRDVVRAYRLLAQGGTPGEIYNLGSGQGTKIADALEHLRSLANGPIPVRVDAARVRAVDLPFLVADASKLRDAVGWEPSYHDRADPGRHARFLPPIVVLSRTEHRMRFIEVIKIQAKSSEPTFRQRIRAHAARDHSDDFECQDGQADDVRRAGGHRRLQ